MELFVENHGDLKVDFTRGQESAHQLPLRVNNKNIFTLSGDRLGEMGLKVSHKTSVQNEICFS